MDSSTESLLNICNCVAALYSLIQPKAGISWKDKDLCYWVFYAVSICNVKIKCQLTDHSLCEKYPDCTGNCLLEENLMFWLTHSISHFWEESLLKGGPYSKLVWSVFSHIWTETEDCSLNLCIQSKYWKLRTRKKWNTDTFYTVNGMC